MLKEMYRREIWTITYKRPPKAYVKGHAGFMKATLKDAILWWHKEILPAHFQQSASAKYNYQRRTYYTQKYKRMFYGHNKPIRLKGTTEEMMESQRPRVSGTGKSARGIMKAPWYIRYRRMKKPAKGSGGSMGLSPDLATEVTRFSAADAKRIGDYIRRSLLWRYASIPATPVTKTLTP